MHNWASAWLREQKTKQEGRALAAAERTAISTKVTAILVGVATALAVASLAWSVWGP